VIPKIVPARSSTFVESLYYVSSPITEAVHAVLFEGMDVIQALRTLMTRESKPK
jgi:glycerol-3-phosphate dehydrogenase